MIKHNIVYSPEGKNLDETTRGYASNITAKKVWQLHNDTGRLGYSAQSYSPVFLMTINKALSPHYDQLLINFSVLVIDEVSIVPSTDFMALMSVNPTAVVCYGDHMQGYPFEAEEFNSDPVNQSPVHALGLVGSPFHLAISAPPRMPQAYAEFFMQFFYKNRANVTLDSLAPLSDHFSILFSNKMFPIKRYRPLREKAEANPKVGHEKPNHVGTFDCLKFYDDRKLHPDFVKSFSQFKPKLAIHAKFCPKVISSKHNCLLALYYQSIMQPRDYYITPYLGQHEFINVVLKHLNSYTLRPVQGQESDYVFYDFVCGTASPFVTNSSQIVALSRFKTHMTLSFVPDIIVANKIWQFSFTERRDVWSNYQSFDLAVRNADKRICSDHNGDNPFKWYFFLKVLELSFSKAGKLPYQLTQDVPKVDFEFDHGTDNYYDDMPHDYDFAPYLPADANID